MEVNFLYIYPDAVHLPRIKIKKIRCARLNMIYKPRKRRIIKLTIDQGKFGILRWKLEDAKWKDQ